MDKFFNPYIDGAINLTIFDLRILYSAEERKKYPLTFKDLNEITCNLAILAAGKLALIKLAPTYNYLVGYLNSSYKDYLAMCERLACDCSRSQRENIRLIIRDIVEQSRKVETNMSEDACGEDTPICALNKDNPWGRAVLALAEAFKVELEAVSA